MVEIINNILILFEYIHHWKIDNNIYFYSFFGLLFGSFCNVLIYRTPLNKNFIIDRSYCTKCYTQLKWYHNIPLFSYIYLKGRCFYCKEKISIQYPLVELTIFISWFIIFNLYSITFYSIILNLIISLFIVLSIIDYKYKAVPDNINLFLLFISIFHNELIFYNVENLLMTSGFMILLKFYTEYFFNKETLGEADIIIAGTMGALLGFQLFFQALVLASIIALIYYFIIFLIKKDKEIIIPFIPFLFIGTVIKYFF